MSALAAFLERRTDARPVAVARIIVGCAACLRCLVSYHLFDQVLTPGVVRGRLFEWVPDMTRGGLPWFTAAWLLVAVGFTLGYRTRLCGSILFALIVYHLSVDLTLFWSNVYYLGVMVLLLTAADAGADLSFDQGARRTTVPFSGVALIKVQLSFVYFVAALAKINPSFLSGSVVGRDALRFEFLNRPEILTALSWGTIALEASMVFALWFKPLRLWAIAGGIILHALIPGLIGLYGGLVVFSVTIIGTYVLFLDQKEFAAAERIFLRSLGFLRPVVLRLRRSA